MPGMRLPRLLTVACVLALPALAQGASKKTITPGQLRICDADYVCVAIDAGATRALARFVARSPASSRRPRPPLGTPYLDLRSVGGGIRAIVATKRLDRFLNYDLHTPNFDGGTWYRLPPKVSAELRRLAVGMRPVPLNWSAIARGDMHP
jgi:hypothetical protein